MGCELCAIPARTRRSGPCCWPRRLLLVVLALEPGSVEFFVTAFAAGILISASGPLIIVAAQERAPHAVAAASGIVMGLAGGAAGLAFVGIGALADAIGLRPALSAGFLASIPAAYIALLGTRSDCSVTDVPSCWCWARRAHVLQAPLSSLPSKTDAARTVDAIRCRERSEHRGRLLGQTLPNLADSRIQRHSPRPMFSPQIRLRSEALRMLDRCLSSLVNRDESRTHGSRSNRVIESLSAEPATGAVTSSGRHTSRRWAGSSSRRRSELSFSWPAAVVAPTVRRGWRVYEERRRRRRGSPVRGFAGRARLGRS